MLIDRDDTRHRVTVTISGPFDAAQVSAFLEQHRLSDACSYGLLYDLRAMIGQPTIAELRRFLSRGVPPDRVHGPLAVIVGTEEMYHMACAYIVMAKPTLVIQVFRFRDDADHWLAAQRVRQRPTP